MSVNIETDELAFFPMLYWPITPQQTTPSAEAYAKLNAYLRSGGMILFDTRDADTARFGASSPNGRKLQELAAPLDIPALEPLPADHVMTRTFYLLQDFPGRHDSRDVWVEAADPNAEQVDGMPFRDLNDGVTPVVIGGNDWAAAWAINSNGTCGGSWYSVGRLNYSTTDKRLTDSVVGLEYDAGCWIARVAVSRWSTGVSEASTQLLMQLELVGLSRLGSNAISILRDNIPGYRLLRDGRSASPGSAFYD